MLQPPHPGCLLALPIPLILPEARCIGAVQP
jgi:hypothetical protein